MQRRIISPRWWYRFALVFFPAHFLFMVAMGRAGALHIVSDGGCLLLVLFSGKPRDFSWLLWPFWLMGAIYEWLGSLLWLRGSIAVDDIYFAEINWFGVAGVGLDGGMGTWANYFAIHNHPILDVICGATYALHLFQIPLLALFFVFRDPHRGRRLTWAVLVTHLMGMVIWLAYPAAPPWYVTEYGLGPAHLDALSSAAGAARFDALFGISYFANFYAQNQNVFGAMPSLHAAFPATILMISWTYSSRVVRLGCMAFLAVMSFSAVYLQHHYILDVIFGWLLAGVGAGIVLAIEAKWGYCQYFEQHK